MFAILAGFLVDESPGAEVPQNWDAVLGEGYCRISEVYEAGPEWSVQSRTRTGVDLAIMYWCARAHQKFDSASIR